MKLIVGLGNPGPRYETTRHNVGFLLVDFLQERWRANSPIQKFNSDLLETSLNSEKVLMMKPKTFMNLSGRSVGPAVEFYKCEPDDIIVIHDDIDLPSGSLRLKTGGGSGGHNGLKSIDECVGAAKTNYHRIRLGVGRPGLEKPNQSVADYVLEPFTDLELRGLEDLFEKAAKAIEMIFKDGSLKAMTQFNKKD
jgi:PTH1 family peptidyl-tRNA hydrolase